MSYPRWLRSDVTYRTVVFEGLIKAEEPLRIGIGREEGPWGVSDLPVIRIREVSKGVETPYIPGTSLKGVYRSTAEQIGKLYGIKPEPCSGLSNDNCMRRDERAKSEISEKIGKDEDYALQKFDEVVCLICKIFGTQSYKSKIHFHDAYPFDSSGEPLPVSTSTKRGIAIDRSTGAVAMGALYNVEYVSPGSTFLLRATSYNLPNYALGLVAKVTKMIKDGYVKLGGFKSRGFGRVGIQRERVSIIHNSPISGDERTLAALSDKGDSEKRVTPTRVEGNSLHFEGEELDQLYKSLLEAWEEYAAASKG